MLFLLGALGMETIFAANYTGGADFLTADWQIWLVIAIEEISEASAIILLIFGLLDHLSRTAGSVGIVFER